MSLESHIMTEIAALRSSNEKLAAKVESLERVIRPESEWVTATEAMAILCCGKNQFYGLHHLHLRRRRGRSYHKPEVESRAARFKTARPQTASPKEAMV